MRKIHNVIASNVFLALLFTWSLPLKNRFITVDNVAYSLKNSDFNACRWSVFATGGGGGGALGYFLGGYVPPGTPNWHPVLDKISPKSDTPFEK